MLGGKTSAARRAFQDGLQLVESKLRKNPLVGENHAFVGLFQARLGNQEKAIAAAYEAFRLDSTNDEVVMKIARIYAILGKKEKMLEWFIRAKAMNPEFDVAYVNTVMDFERYRSDRDLLLIARQE